VRAFRFVELSFWGSTILVCAIGFVKHFGYIEATPFAVCVWIAIERAEQAWTRRRQ
jgi:hypothetical protein